MIIEQYYTWYSRGGLPVRIERGHTVDISLAFLLCFFCVCSQHSLFCPAVFRMLLFSLTYRTHQRVRRNGGKHLMDGTFRIPFGEEFSIGRLDDFLSPFLENPPPIEPTNTLSLLFGHAEKVNHDTQPRRPSPRTAV